MAQIEDVLKALRAADAAGNTEDAARLAQLAQQMRTTPAVPALANPVESPVPADPAGPGAQRFPVSPDQLAAVPAIPSPADVLARAMSPEAPITPVDGMGLGADGGAAWARDEAARKAAAEANPVTDPVKTTSRPEMKRPVVPLAADPTRGPIFEELGRANPGSLSDQAAAARIIAEAMDPTTRSPFKPTPQDYTPTGEAIMSELGNVPERIQRGFLGNRLASAERRIVGGLQTIGLAKDADARLADLTAQKEAKFAAWQAATSPDERNILIGEYNSLAEMEKALADQIAAGRPAEVIEEGRGRVEDAQRLRAPTQASINDLEAAMTPVNPAPGLPQALVSGIASVGDMAPGMVATLATRNPLPMLAYLGAYSRGSTYVDKRAEGYDSGKAVTAANLYAVAEAVPELLPLHVILKEGGGALSKIVGGTATEAASEVLTQGLQQLVDMGVLDESMTWAQAQQEMIDSGMAGGVMGALMGGGGAIAESMRDTVASRRAKKGTPADPTATGPAPVEKPPQDEPPAMPPLNLAPEMRTEAAANGDTAPVVPGPETPPQPEPDRSRTGAGLEPDSAPQVPETRPDTPAPGATISATDAEAAPDRYEIMDEIEGVGPGARPTGRRVARDRQTGAFLVVDEIPASAVAGDPPGTPPPSPAGESSQVVPSADAGRAGGTPADQEPQTPEDQLAAAMAPAAATVPQTRRPNQPDNVEFIDAQGVSQIGTEPGVMQYKAGGDEAGVTDRLRGVTEWRPERAGMSIVYEYADGRRVIADGHQRLGLAKRLAGEGKQVQMPAIILRQRDGITPEEARVTAALKNIAEGSGTAVDAAKVLRGSNQTAEQMGLPPNSAIVRDAMGMRNLSDQAFGMVVNGVSSERDGGIVGRIVQNKEAQANILALLNRLKPSNAFQAESIARQAAADVVTETQDSLFGPEMDTQNLYLERAKILDGAAKMNRDEMRAFGTVVQNADRLQAAGNVLDAASNQSRMDSAAAMRDYLGKEANTKGAISDALTAAARALHGGAKPGEAIRQFLAAVERELGARGQDRPVRDEGGRAPERPGGESTEPESLTPEAQIAAAMKPDAGGDLFGAKSPTAKDQDKADADLIGDLFGGTPQTGKTPEQERAEAEAAVKGNQSKIRTAAPQGDAGPLFNPQAELPTEAPKPRKPQTPEELIQQGRAILQAYSNADDERLFSMTGTDLRERSAGKKLATDLLSAKTVSEKQKVADQWVLAEGRRTGKEHLVVLDKNGVPLAIMSGGKDWVTVRPDVLRAADAGLVDYATHNHPRSTSHSPGDITMMFSGFKTVVVMAHDGERHAVSTVPGVAMDWSGKKGNGVPEGRSLSEALDDFRYAASKTIYEGIFNNDAIATDGKPDRFMRASSALFPAILDRMGLIRYSQAEAATDFLATEGFNLEDIYGQVSGSGIDRLRRAGLVIPESGDRGGDRAPAGGAEAAPPGTGGADRGADQDGDGRSLTGDADFDGALDALFGKENGDVSGTGNGLERDRGDADPADAVGGADVPASGGRPGAGAPKRGGSARGGDGQPSAGGGLPDGDAAPVGASGDPALPGGRRAEGKPAGGRKRGSGAGGGKRRLSSDTGRAAHAGTDAAGPADLDRADADLIGKLFKEDVPAFEPAPKTETEAFKRWFGDSKVVDTKGKPLVVYHGTAHDFDAFESENLLTWASEGKNLPLLYADSSAYFSGWGTDNEGGGQNLLPLYMRIERPFDADLGLPKSVDIATMMNAMIEQALDAGRSPSDDLSAKILDLSNTIRKAARREESGPRYSRHDFWYDSAALFGRDGAAAIREAFDLLGFDGIKMIEKGEQTWGAFQPHQVKSVFNRGTFDPDSPFMLHEDAAGIDAQKFDALRHMFDRRLDGVDLETTPRQQVFVQMMRPLIDAGVTRAQLAALKPYFDHYLNERATARLPAKPTAQKPIEGESRAEMQAKADRVRPIPADRDNIDKTLPLLLPEQRDDVMKAETRFAKPDGHGFMLTNGTGTGKTFSGGGVVKRFVQQGKGNILIVAPSDAVIAGWMRALEALGVPASQLANVKDAGQGVVLTTYANLEQNNAVASRDWHLIVTDESQHLSSNAEGAPTGALDAVRAISHRPADLWRKSRMLHADEWAAYKAMRASEAKTALFNRLKAREEREVATFAAKPRAKVMFLSATPFAYDKSVDYAEGYLFDYPKDGHVGRSRQDGRSLFFVQNFGYRIRYHKLTKPEAAVDSAVFEREFHMKLRRDGVLSGRSLQVDVDYDRKFVTVSDAIGEKIDAVLSDIFKGGSNPDKALADGYRTLSQRLRAAFDYHKRMQLLEAIKARAAIPDIKKHLALGRKVVVFHDFNVGGGFNPFLGIVPADDANAIAAMADLMAKHPDLNRLNFSGYGAPADALSAAFGDKARLFSGRVPKKKRLQHLADFNTDGSGVDVLVVQADAGGAGISMHDTTGSHQRVLINLGMPVKPTTTLQQEGRILRVGSVSDAPFRYYTIGTTWERMAFARTIAERSGAVENLALGNEARDLMMGFIDAYTEAEPRDPSPDDGKGGKERDRRVTAATPYQAAITHYFGRTKVTGRRDQREGLDFYPTPEPLAYKMVEWAGIRPNERVLEPSAGDGAIARYMPADGVDLTLVEPSDDLGSRALLRAPGARLVGSTFEGYHMVNKHHVIVMNPPFGMGGKTAMDHLSKAARHLRPGGRIVALIPTGPSADRRFDAWWESDDAKGLTMSAEVILPAVAFERAGTNVMTRVVIIDKVAGDAGPSQAKRLNFAGAQSIKDFFDRLERYDVPRRPEAQTDAATEIEAEATGGDAAAPVERPQAPPLGASLTFKSAQTVHGKTGAPLFVATAEARTDDATYKAMLAVAKAHGGWYSSFRGAGAIPGFQFKTEDARKAFLDDMAKPVTGFEETAYHGTPHDFDQFSLDAIGSGEGAQVYGWGLYFAGDRKVSEWYRNKLTRKDILLDGAEVPMTMRARHMNAAIMADWEAFAKKHPFKPPQVDFEISASEMRDAEVLYPTSLRTVFLTIVEEVTGSGRPLGAWLDRIRQSEIDRVQKIGHLPHYLAEITARLAAIDTLRKAVSVSGSGRLFTVEIPDGDDLIDWDEDLSDASEGVREKLKPVTDVMLQHFKKRQNIYTSDPESMVFDRPGEDIISFIQSHGPMYGLPAEGITFAKTTKPGKSYVVHQVIDDATGEVIGEADEKAKALSMAGIAPDRYASMVLKKLGFKGHRYLDGNSRRDGDGTHNYVIYDDAAIRIIQKEQRQQMMREASAATSEVVRLLPRLRAELDRLDLKRVRLGIETGVDWQGAFAVTGDGAMEIVIGASLDPMKTLHHEVIHALRMMDLFTPAEWKVLELAGETWMEKHDIAARYPDLSHSEQIEEAIAEEFSEALAAKKAPRGSLLIQAFNKIARLFKAIANVLRGAGFHTAEDIFGRVLAGEIGRRAANNTGLGFAYQAARRGEADGKPANQKFARQPLAARPASMHARANRATAMAGSIFIPDRGVWDELTRAGAPIWDRLRGARGGTSDAIDRARAKVQDRFLPVLRAQQEIMRATGRALPATHDAYVAETTFSGKVGRHLFEVDENFTKPIIDLISQAKGELSVEDVGLWLYARHALERNARIASINPKMPDGGSGMTNAEARQILADAAASLHAQRLLAIGAKIDGLRERTLKLREDSGLITHDEALMWRQMYKHYVPLKGFADTDHSEATLDLSGIGRRFNIRGQESKRALGRQSEAFNPLQAALTQAQEVAIRAEKNRVGVAMYELAKDHPSPALWTVKKPAQKRYFNRTTGMVETRVEDPVTLIMEPNEMAVKVDGEEVRILFHDERLSRALGTVGADQMGTFLRLIAPLSRWFSMARTMLNPEFVITNAIRDFEAAEINIAGLDTAGKGRIALAMVKNWRKAFAGAMRGQTNKADTEWSRHFRDFQQAGAQVSFWTMDSPEAGRADLERRLKLKRGNAAIRALRSMTALSMRDNVFLSTVERVNLAVDNAIRLAAFVEAQKMGMSVERAAFMAKELTVNFNRRGEWGAALNTVYPFFNAATQGTTRLLQAMRNPKLLVGLTVGGIGLGLIMDMVNAALSDEDDDGELLYDKIPDYRNRRNLHLVLGGGSSAVAVPMAYGYNIFPYIGQQLGKVSRGAKAWDEAMADVGATFLQAYMPTDSLIPGLVDPIYEIATNENYFGSSIYPDDFYGNNAYLPDASKYFPSASAASVWIAGKLNEITGGNAVTSGWIDVSPEVIDHVSAFVVGSAGSFYGRSFDTLGKALSGKADDIETKDIPFLRVVRSEVSPWIDKDRFRQFGAEVEDAHYDLGAWPSGSPVPVDVQRKAAMYDFLLQVRREMRGRGEFNQNSRNFARLPRDERTIIMEFNREFLKVAGKQAE